MPDIPFPPPPDAACFFVGPVMHARMKPVAHRFTYRVFNLLIDLDKLKEAGRLSRFFSLGRFNVLSFRAADHGPLARGNGGDPRGAITRILKDAGVEDAPSRILLLCYPRVFGFVFNPISVYFCYREDQRLMAVVYEVRNTFGDRHSYVSPVRDGELSAAGLRQRAEKLFYVSPFMPPQLTYHFRLRPPNKADVALRILETDGEGPMLAATFTGEREAITDATCLRLAFGLPLMTLKVVLGIHWEALKLFVKGVPFFHRPKAPPPASLDGRFLVPPPSSTKGKTA